MDSPAHTRDPVGTGTSTRVCRDEPVEIVCEPGAAGDSGELFRLVLGGYGLFGVLSEVVLSVNENVKLSMEMLQLLAKPEQ